MPATEYVTLSDFSPGIHADYHGGSGTNGYTRPTVTPIRGFVAVQGAATVDGTYRCCADKQGALVPLPARTTQVTQTQIPEGNAVATANYPTELKGAYLMDALITAPTATSTFWGVTANREDDYFIQTMWQFAYDSAAASRRHYILGRRHRIEDGVVSGVAADWLFEEGEIVLNNIPTWHLLSGNIGMHRATSSASITSNSLNPGMFFAARRLRTARLAAIPAAALPYTTFDTDVSTNFPTGVIAATQVDGFVGTYPDPATPGVASTYVYDLPQFPAWGISHQGRVVVVCRQATTFGFGSIRHTRDTIFYTPVNDFKGLSGAVAFVTEFGEENVTGIGTMASLNGSQLFIVKHDGGAYLVQGDLAAPTVSRLPYVESTHGITSQCVSTPIGVVYGTRNGVFVWNGGDRSEKLSNQIDGFFWDHAALGEQYEANRGRFGYWHPFVCVPNNYVFNTESQSWWRLETPDAMPQINTAVLSGSAYSNRGVTYNVYATGSSNNFLYAFPYKIDSVQNDMVHLYKPEVLASSYSWKSHPLLETRDRIRAFSELKLAASPGENTALCTVTVTLTGIDADGDALTPVVTVFTFTGTGTGNPVVLVKDLVTNFNAMYVQVRIEASAAAGAAPKIMGLSIGTDERTRNPAS